MKNNNANMQLAAAMFILPAIAFAFVFGMLFDFPIPFYTENREIIIQDTNAIIGENHWYCEISATDGSAYVLVLGIGSKYYCVGKQWNSSSAIRPGEKYNIQLQPKLTGGYSTDTMSHWNPNPRIFNIERV
jgi:hypothetical protein